MLLQNNFDLQLEKFFRIFDAKFASKICGPFCVCLKKKRHPIECDFDNVVDGNSISSGAQLKMSPQCLPERQRNTIISSCFWYGMKRF